MKYILPFIGLVTLLTITSCGNSSADSNTNDSGPVPAATKDTTVPTTNAQPAITPVTTALPAGNQALNPAHGQPGHRCDIAVGAPLDSKPAAPVQAQPVQTSTQQVSVSPPTTTTSLTAPTTTKSGVGLNPAHGQPGHRCEIPVGAPLDSKPVAATATPVPFAPDSAKSSPVSVTTNPVTTTPAATVTAPGMNPPHGQPGHRCDIAVGAPLNSAPKKN